MLDAGTVNDFGHVFLDGQEIGVTDRRSRIFKLKLPARKAPGQLDIFVETQGRVNFGKEVLDHKGLLGPVKLVQGTTATELAGPWQVFKLALDKGPNEGAPLKYGEPGKGPGYWDMTVNLEKAADTFLDVSTWGKGVVWVNGHCLGRFWSIGPTQTMYIPGPWLKAGANSVVVLDTVGPTKPVIAGLAKPILDKLQPERDFGPQRRPDVKLALAGVAPAHSGQFAPGAATQEVLFAKPATGRYFCIEAIDALDGKQFAAIAELDVLDKDGKPLSHEKWTIAYVDSEERTAEDGSAENAIDGQTANYWHTQWQAAQPAFPHRLILDLGSSQTVGGLRYVPRQGATVTGRIKDYKVYVGDGLVVK